MGRRPRPRGPVHDGVLIVDKPAGPTSHDVVDAVRRAVGHSRVGHTGTLDPAATGVLVLCVGRATRLVPFLQAGEKTYSASMVLGVQTTSQDADGEVVARHDASHLDERTVCDVLTRFQGEIDQLPPMVSAVRVGGERLHVRARRGEVVERDTRRVTVSSLVLDSFTPGPTAHASFLVTCSAGTYVRTIAHDAGAELGVGGSLTALRRLANGPFGIADAVDLDAIERAGHEDGARQLLLDPLEAVRRALPTTDVSDRDLLVRLANGGRMPGAPPAPTFAVVATGSTIADGGKLLGVYEEGQDGRDGARPAFVWTRPEELA